jgi:hypothetical protein
MNFIIVSYLQRINTTVTLKVYKGDVTLLNWHTCVHITQSVWVLGYGMEGRGVGIRFVVGARNSVGPGIALALPQSSRTIGGKTNSPRLAENVVRKVRRKIHTGFLPENLKIKKPLAGTTYRWGNIIMDLKEM